MKNLPNWFYIGLLLNLSFWAISWLSVKPFSYYSFFFIWFGFILILDGLNYRFGKSLLNKDKLSFVFLFLLSAVFWWYFEIVVDITRNWYYITEHNFSVGLRQIAGTFFFSTVIIGVFEIITLIKNLNLFGKEIRWITLPKLTPIIFFLAGILSIPLTISHPQYFYPFLWLTVFLLIDPVNYWLGNDSLIRDARKGDWTRAVYFGMGTLIAGLCWEMWNEYADPKWVYAVPFFGVYKVFEMPILGFLGYIPFGFEIFSLYFLLQGIFGFPKDNFVIFDKEINKKKNNPRIILLIGFILVVIANIGIGYIHKKDSEIFFNLEEQQQFSKTDNKVDLDNQYYGEIVNCGYSLTVNRCLLLNDGKVYWLKTRTQERVNTDLGKVVVTGKLSQENTGLDELEVQKIEFLK